MPRPPRRPRSATLPELLAQIAALDVQGAELDPRALARAGHGDLVEDARRLAGSWREALVLAGAIDRRGLQRWSRAKVVGRLRRLQAQGLPITVVRLRQGGHTNVVRAAWAHFGSWQAACRAAGIPVAPRGGRRWTRTTIVAELRRLAATGQRMTSTALTRAGHTPVVKGVMRYLGGWANGLRVAGIASPRVRWTRAHVLAVIKDRHERGASMSSKVLQHEPRGQVLVEAGKRFFGSWPAAVAAAGLRPASAPLWTREKVVRELRRVARGRKVVSTSDLTRAGHGHLVSAAQRRFGDWATAARAAGFVPAGRGPRKRRSRARW